MNAISVIAPYKHHGMWVFDDPRVGLVQEPFVAGADTMIDRVVADIPDAERGFTLIFSPALRSPDTNIGLIGSVKKAVATGTIQRTWAWKAGSAQPCSGTSKRRQSSYLSKRSPPGSAASRVQPRRRGRFRRAWPRLVIFIKYPTARDETEGRRRAGLHSGIGPNEIELSNADRRALRADRRGAF